MEFLSKLGFSAAFIVLTVSLSVMSQNAPCKFDPATLQFSGAPFEQARCLLRPNGKGGVLGNQLSRLPDPLEKLVGKEVKVSVGALRKYLADRGIVEDSIGGRLDRPLAEATLPNGSKVRAIYFVIHDTSSPYLADEEFPADLNANPTNKANNLSPWASQPVAHIFVNRLGDSLTTTPFDEPVRKGFGTKFARDFLKADAKGLQIHIELVQPRRRDPADRNPKNDLIAPVPGFTDAQYRRLALLYLVASVRRGSWLIPGYHSAFDAGIKDAHDDPQNFELKEFAGALAKLLKDVR